MPWSTRSRWWVDIHASEQAKPPETWEPLTVWHPHERSRGATALAATFDRAVHLTLVWTQEDIDGSLGAGQADL